MKSNDALVRQLLESKPPGDTHHVAYLSTEAAERRREFHNAIELMMAEGEELEDVRDIASKVVSQTVKLALVLHLAATPELLAQEKSEISVETWSKAQILGTYHLQEAIRVQRMADEDKDAHKARRLLEWIKRENRKEVTTTDLMQNGPRPRPKAAEAKRILELLADHGYLIAQERSEYRNPVYIVNPRLSQLSQFSRGVS